MEERWEYQEKNLRDLRLQGSKNAEGYVKQLLDQFLIIRSGVTTVKFVATKLASPWLLHSFKTNKEEATASKPVNNKVEEIDILLRPWLRINGTLNRRVF